MDSNHRLVLFTHALCRLSYPATLGPMPRLYRNPAKRSVRLLWVAVPSDAKRLSLDVGFADSPDGALLEPMDPGPVVTTMQHPDSLSVAHSWV
jgi:hypothetical protein